MLFEEGVKYMEQEMEEIGEFAPVNFPTYYADTPPPDQQERIENPPRELKI